MSVDQADQEQKETSAAEETSSRSSNSNGVSPRSVLKETMKVAELLVVEPDHPINHSLEVDGLSQSLIKSSLSSPSPSSASSNSQQPKLMQPPLNASTPIPHASSNSPDPIMDNLPQETVGNAVTVIEVQSGNEVLKKSNNNAAASGELERDRMNASNVDAIRSSNGTSNAEISATRINVTSGETSQQNFSSEAVEQEPAVPVVRGLEDKEEAGRGTLRLGQGRRYPSGHFDDNASDISSIVNNPSVISQLPDRYGFLGGEQYTHESEPEPSPEMVRRREMKWLAMLDKWDHFMRKDFKTVKSRCRKGIPRSVRGRAWFYLCGASHLKKKNPHVFFQLCQREGKPECIEDIKKDLHRQFPWHEIFAEEGHGQKDLYNVLKAYSILNAKDGYCQAQAPIAAILLMHMPSEDAFWCLVAICEKYLKGYYSPGMQQVQLDGDILFGLLKRVAPPVYKHLKKQKIDPVLYMTEWFLCAFTRTLPWPSVLRVWDSFLCEGVKVLFRVGLVLLKYTLGRTGILKECPNMYDTLMQLKNIPSNVTHEQFLVVQVQRLDISDDQMRREHYKQMNKRKKAQQKSDAAKKQQQKSTSVSIINTSAATVQRSHETAL